MKTLKIDLTGKTFDRLTVVSFAGRNKNHQAKWLCLCSCGETKVVYGYNLTAGHTTSCGCFQREGVSARFTTHGHSANDELSPTYVSWANMIQRCTNPNAINYHRYGGRGIKVHPEWMTFAGFLRDMGERPEGTELDRIDNNGNYGPGGNVRWLSKAENVRRSWAARRLAKTAPEALAA